MILDIDERDRQLILGALIGLQIQLANNEVDEYKRYTYEERIKLISLSNDLELRIKNA